MIAVPWVWVGGLLASAVLTHHVLKPRLPVYRIEPLIGFPKFVWITDGSDVNNDNHINFDDDKHDGTGNQKNSTIADTSSKGQKIKKENVFHLGLPMSISMHNDNYLEIDVYSLTFNMFYMNSAGDLLHLADIKDHIQVQQSQKVQREKTSATEGYIAKNTTAKAETVSPLWQLAGKSNFATNDVLYISMETSLLTNLLLNSRFYSSLWQGTGSFWLPTTGVAHVKATKGGRPGMPATISIICDNYVNMLVVQGLSCVLHDAQPGWNSLKAISRKLVAHATTKLRANGMGLVLGPESEEMKSERT